MPRLFTATVGLIVALVLCSGCAHYQLGTGSQPAFRSIFVEPATNQTLVPQAQALLTTHLREAFLRDSRVQSVNSAAAAEVTLSVAIAEYRRDIAAVRDGDTGLARKFNVTLGANCTLRDNRSGKLLWDKRPIRATREVFTDSGQLQSEYQALALLTEALAARILRTGLDTW
jgi:hypothetical protein